MAASKIGARLPIPPKALPFLQKTDRFGFESARLRVLGEGVFWEGVGALSEKTLHKIMKLYIEPDTAYHEVPFLGSIADVKNSAGVFEIQNGAYNRLLPKLRKMLPKSLVTVVIPLSFEKSVAWIDKSTGEISDKKKSPKHEDIYDALYALFWIRDVINCENLNIRIIFLRSEEFKSLDGWDKSKKRGATRIDRIPCEIICELLLEKDFDFRVFLPEGLPEEFVAKDFAKMIKRPSRHAYYVLKFLVFSGALSEAGKRGKAVVYKINK